MGSLLLYLLLSGLSSRTYEAFKSKYDDADAAHKGEKDGAEDWENQDEWVIYLEIVFISTYEVKFFCHVSWS